MKVGCYFLAEMIKVGLAHSLLTGLDFRHEGPGTMNYWTQSRFQ